MKEKLPLSSFLSLFRLSVPCMFTVLSFSGKKDMAAGGRSVVPWCTDTVTELWSPLRFEETRTVAWDSIPYSARKRDFKN